MSAILSVAFSYPQDLSDDQLEAKYKEALIRILETIRELASDELEMKVLMSVREIDDNDPKWYHSDDYPNITLVADVPNDDFNESEETRKWIQKKSIHLLKELESIFDIEISIFSWWRPFTCNFPNIA